MKKAMAVFAVIVIMSSFLSAQVTIYTPANRPDPPALGDLPLQSSVSQYGITWTFNQPVRVGRFITGDYYVVGPVTVTAINPAPAGGRNGSMLNPPANYYPGYDSRVFEYRSSSLTAPPVNMVPGNSLVSSISLENLNLLPLFNTGETPVQTYLKDAAILTCLSAPAAADVFRPSYCDVNNNLYRSSDLRRELLPKVPAVAGTPSFSFWEQVFERPWIDHPLSWNNRLVHPINNMPEYAREVGRAVGIAGLLLMLDVSDQQKEQLLLSFVQYGIDLWGIARIGGSWRAAGGYGTGRKWPIIFAGMLLGNNQMQQPKTYVPNALFGEDQQTMYGNGWTGATAVFGGLFGSGATGIDGPYEHLQPRDWPGRGGEDYRRCCTSIAWIGFALSARMMHAESIWNHDAFFDYCDRWMHEDDTEHVATILSQTGYNYYASYGRQRQCWDSFVNNMWSAYRFNLPPPLRIAPFKEDPSIIPNEPTSFELLQNYPNPFNPTTSIKYSLPKNSSVKITIYNLLGIEIKTLVNEKQTAGTYDIKFDASGLSSGIYFYKIQAGEFMQSRKMLLTK